MSEAKLIKVVQGPYEDSCHFCGADAPEKLFRQGGSAASNGWTHMGRLGPEGEYIYGPEVAHKACATKHTGKSFIAPGSEAEP